jgi:phosphatidylglycerol:prolipoprotein diacylglycerol transferase
MNLYGIFLTLGIIIGSYIADRINKKLSIVKGQLSAVDILPWILIPGIIGARAYHVIDYWSYYSQAPIEIIKIWNGGMGIFGAIIAGALGLFIFTYRRIKSANTKKPHYSLLITHYLNLLDLSAIALPIGQAIGRFGNYFNQELYGLATDLPWGVYISIDKRPPGLINYEYFHPLFFYESIGCLVIFVIILLISRSRSERSTRSWSVRSGTAFFSCLFLYSLLRFFLEFLRIRNWMIGNIRVNQLVSLIFMVASLLFFLIKCYNCQNAK